ncbi:MAG: Fe-S-containing hydro-lyase [Clostridia bacterium]|nr:Fe-S-containing hydro-lyase [Clostridia bacterium]
MEALKIRVEDLNDEKIKSLAAGDSVLLSGVIYTARDAAHERMVKNYEKGIDFPFDIKGQAIYYAGPCPAKPGEVIGSCGPTTAGRMDAYTPLLLDKGLKIMIGKGARSSEVVDAIRRNNCVYLGAIGGAGALIAECIKKVRVIAYDDLGTEAIREMYVEDFPCTVLIDSDGNNIYEIGQEKYREI